MDTIRARYLFHQYFNKKATPEEKEAFLEWVGKAENAEQVKSLMKDFWEQFQGDERIFSAVQSDKVFEQIKQLLSEETKTPVPEKKKHFLWPGMAAAVLLVLMIGSIFIYFINKNNNKNITPVAMSMKNDVAPGGNKAVLTLSNGMKIDLNEANNGLLTSQGQTKIIKKDSGQLTYENADRDATSNTIQYNTLATPRGGQYQLMLPDGSKVWLNAASSIRYPTAFAGEERKVEVTGEVYFEVAKNQNKPFSVVAGQMTVEVLGTHFNINTYKDEPVARTTLLEGSVKITAQDKSMLLRPGQQAGIKKGSNEIVRSDANMDEVVAWKDGVFHFEGDDMADIMRRISRWYNVEVTYKNGVPKGHYTGVISRNTNLSQVLEVLELSGIHFEIKGRNILVEG